MWYVHLKGKSGECQLLENSEDFTYEGHWDPQHELPNEGKAFLAWQRESSYNDPTIVCAESHRTYRHAAILGTGHG